MLRGLSRVSGVFLNAPEVRKIGNAIKMTDTVVDAWREFKNKLTEYFGFAHLYKQPGQLERRFVDDLVQRLPTYARQRFMN